MFTHRSLTLTTADHSRLLKRLLHRILRCREYQGHLATEDTVVLSRTVSVDVLIQQRTRHTGSVGLGTNHFRFFRSHVATDECVITGAAPVALGNQNLVLAWGNGDSSVTLSGPREFHDQLPTVTAICPSVHFGKLPFYQGKIGALSQTSLLNDG